MALFGLIKPRKKVDGAKGEQPNRPTVRRFHGRRGARVPLYEDLPTGMERRAYEIIHEQDSTFAPLQKRGQKCGGFVPVVVGEGERKDQMQEVVDHCRGVPQILEHLSYADLEGARFAWMKAEAFGRMNVVNFLGGAGRKVLAGGDIWWGGYGSDDAVRLAPLNGIRGDGDEDVTLDRKSLLVFCPSAEINPEGNTMMAVSMYKIARLSAVLSIAETVYTERHGLPKEVVEVILKEFDAASVNTAINDAASALRGSSAMDVMGLTPAEIVKLLEPTGTTWKFLQALRVSVQSRAHRLVTGESISSGMEQGGDVGSSDLAEKQFFSKAAYIMKMMAEPFSHEFLPFLEKINDHWLAPKRKKDKPMFIEFRPAVEKTKLTVQELLQSMDRGVPIRWEECYSVLGLTEIEKLRETYGDHYFKPNLITSGGGNPDDEQVPSSTGDSTQRSDREAPGSGIDDKMTRKQDSKKDIRNVDNDEEEDE